MIKLFKFLFNFWETVDTDVIKLTQLVAFVQNRKIHFKENNFTNLRQETLANHHIFLEHQHSQSKHLLFYL